MTSTPSSRSTHRRARLGPGGSAHALARDAAGGVGGAAQARSEQLGLSLVRSSGLGEARGSRPTQALKRAARSTAVKCCAKTSPAGPRQSALVSHFRQHRQAAPRTFIDFLCQPTGIDLAVTRRTMAENSRTVAVWLHDDHARLIVGASEQVQSMGNTGSHCRGDWRGAMAQDQGDPRVPSG